MRKLMIGLMAAVLLLGLLPINKGFAYAGGLLQGKQYWLTNEHEFELIVPVHYRMADGDEASYSPELYRDGLSADFENGIWFELDSIKSINKSQYKFGNTTAGSMQLSLYDSNKTLLQTITLTGTQGTIQFPSVSNVKYVSFWTKDTSMNPFVYEVDVFEAIPEQPVYTGNKYIYNQDFTVTGNITNTALLFDDFASTAARIGYSSTITFDFKNEVTIKDLLTIGPGMNFSFYDSKGGYLKSFNTGSNVGSTKAATNQVLLNGVKRVTMGNSSGNYMDMSYLAFTYDKQYLKATELQAEPGERDIKLSWKNPSDSDLKESWIYLNGNKVKTVDKALTSTTLTGLTPETNYTIKIISSYASGGQAASAEITAKTLVEVIKKVLEANATTDYDRVNLSWKLPEQYGFKHVNIYRKEITEEPGFFESLFMGVIVSAAEEPKKIFETNGTYFNDFTVTPETSYEYTLTTQTVEGKESEPVIVEATTLEEPAPKIEGEKYEVDQNGDYLFTWKQPTEGTVKIIVGGKEYTTTEAANGQFLIPKQDMKLNGLGDPDVILQPISKYGTVGEKTSTSENNSILKLPFSVNDFVLSGFELFAYVGSFLLLALSFLLFPKLRALVFNSFRGSRKGEKADIENTSPRRFRDIQNEARERHEGKEHLDKTEREIKERQGKERIERERQEREKRERAAEPKVISPKPSRERTRSRQRAEKQPRASREARQPRERTRAARQPREPRGKRRA